MEPAGEKRQWYAHKKQRHKNVPSIHVMASSSKSLSSRARLRARAGESVAFVVALGARHGTNPPPLNYRIGPSAERKSAFLLRAIPLFKALINDAESTKTIY